MGLQQVFQDLSCIVPNSAAIMTRCSSCEWRAKVLRLRMNTPWQGTQVTKHTKSRGSLHTDEGLPVLVSAVPSVLGE